MDPDTVWQAIFGQESNYGKDLRTSVTGARGPGQIQPQTFKDYALPGESIKNYDDNIRVSKRIVSDLYNRFGGDPARIATAYFSGPSNVSPSNVTQPYVKDKKDPKGKSVSSYVADISRRLKQMPSQNFDADAAFGQWEAATSPKGDNFNPEAAFSKWEKSAQAPQQQTKPSGSNIPVPTEGMTPQQLAEYKLSLARGKEGAPSFFSQYRPFSAIPEMVGSGVAQLGRGVKEIQSGNVATGTGNVGMGALSAIGGPVMAPIAETARFGGTLIGNPHAAEVASLLLPAKGAGTAIKSQIPAVKAAGGIIDLVGKENVPNVLRKLENNPNLSLMDVSEPVRTVAAGLANSPKTPAAQNVMRSAYDQRVSERQNVVQKAMDETLGPPINVKEYLDQLTENVRKVGAQRINPALEGAQPIGVLPIAARIDEVIKAPGTADEVIKRLSKLKDQLTAEAGKDGFIDPQKLHGIQWRLRAEADNLAKSATGSERSLAAPLFNARNDMVSAIDAASGGKYKPALAGFRDESHVKDAFEKGFDIFKTGGVQDFPEYWRAWIKDAQPAEIAAAKVGAITAARRNIEGMQGGSRRGETILGPTFNKDKVSALFGEQQTNQLSGLLEDARNMSHTNSLLYQNSKTAQVTAGQKYFEPRDVGAPAGAATSIGVGTLGAMISALGYPEAGVVAAGYGALKGAHMGAQYLGRISDKRTATRFAELVSATGEERNKLISLLRSASESGSGNKVGNLLPSLVRLAAP